jgi:hypothetical protein
VPALTDPDRLAAYRDALGNWEATGFIEFELTEESYRWVRRELDGMTLKEIKRLMHDYVADGGEIDETPETRPEWRDEFDFHFDLRPVIQGKRVYIETRLHFRLPLERDESWIKVVNIHEC